MRKLYNAVCKIPILGRILLIFYRFFCALKQFTGPFGRLIRWLFTSRETTNYTFQLEKGNQEYLEFLISDILDIPLHEVQKYTKELEDDEELRRHIETQTALSPWAHLADREVRYSRRIGWYAFVRALKPQVVIETGVDKGLGACVLAAALLRNAAEGHPGQYYGTDINPKAGYLLSGRYAEVGRVLYGDSIESLRAFQEPIDLFINDSDHSADYEAREYETVFPKLSPNAVLLGDNSHSTDKLMQFSLAHNRHFSLFLEKPKDHWYQGAGIGISFRKEALNLKAAVLAEEKTKSLV